MVNVRTKRKQIVYKCMQCTNTRYIAKANMHLRLREIKAQAFLSVCQFGSQYYNNIVSKNIFTCLDYCYTDKCVCLCVND